LKPQKHNRPRLYHEGGWCRLQSSTLGSAYSDTRLPWRHAV